MRRVRATRATPAIIVAAAAGFVHAAFSFYWAMGGTWLAWSLGNDLRTTFEGREWLLLPVGWVKLVAALLPAFWARHGWIAHSVARWMCGIGAAVLMAWGGANTVVGGLVLAGLIVPESGYDKGGMIGHALLWDPLFLLWGVALAVAIAAATPTRYRQPAQST